MQRQVEEQQRKDLAARQASGAELVAQHYNAVPERGREWRSTESKIKGLRSLNNWIKSTLIQKFSRPEMPVEHMKVLDMACGKGGDLGKWEKALKYPPYTSVATSPTSASIRHVQDTVKICEEADAIEELHLCTQNSTCKTLSGRH